MQIESGSTAWWRNRNLMFLALFLAAAAWFAYDGYIKYPSKNIEWAAQAMQAPASDIQANPEVTRSAIEKLQADLKARGSISYNELIDELKAHLGKPTLERENEHWWVGPAIFVKASVVNGRAELDVQQSKEYPESSIMGQKWFALLLLVLAGLVGVNLLRVLTTKVVLDDAGLRYNRKQIPWDAMTGLRTEDYSRKYWVDLEYTAGGATRSLRLDSFHIDRFNEIVTAICEQKGFTCPVLAKKTSGEAEDAQPPQA